jgi:hypothetical protein
MKRIRIAAFSLALLSTIIANAKPIVKLKVKGGTQHQDGTVTYYSVKAVSVTEPASGWSLTCKGGGPNDCAAPANKPTRQEHTGLDDYDFYIGLELQQYVMRQIYVDGRKKGSYFITTVAPDGLKRTYMATWENPDTEDADYIATIERTDI